MASKIITTRDGSRSVFSNRFQQHYHNIAGALTESRNVFFDNTGLSKALAEHRDITLVEVGFGTGLHVALLECMRKRTGSRSQVHYYSVEKFPLEGDVVRRMDFGRICPGMDEVVGRIADALFEARDGESVSVTITPDKPAVAEKGLPDVENTAGTPFTRVEVFRSDFHDWDLSVLNRPAQIILHDAFSPDTNPDLWTVATFRKLLEAADPHAMLGTYCSATRARAAMILGGWHIGRVQGPPGKREVSVASPDAAMLSAFKRVNEELLMKRFREELS
ncbi:MAG: hypothetical protein EA363_00740 [Balneolaceae bacterium]|nr:MAG: hypothetical protein EA363_00740 [Balneolaceae bacterium]